MLWNTLEKKGVDNGSERQSNGWFKIKPRSILDLKQIILGTAGHIDHGKTSLIKAAHRNQYRPAKGRKASRHHH